VLHGTDGNIIELVTVSVRPSESSALDNTETNRSGKVFSILEYKSSRKQFFAILLSLLTLILDYYRYKSFTAETNPVSQR
jgi:hypothetical protein